MNSDKLLETGHVGSLYLGNKMVGIPYFNAPWFDKMAAVLRQVPGVTGVFNPADEDRKMGFEPMNCPNGTAEEAAQFGFNRRKALGADWSWIARYSDGMIVGPDWDHSTGTISEIACHNALGLPVWEDCKFLPIIESGDFVALLLNPLRQLPPLHQMI